MSALLLFATGSLSAQTACSEAIKTAALAKLHQAQAAVLSIKQAPMDSGVPRTAIPSVRAFRAALVAAADAVMACSSAASTPPALGHDLQASLRAAAPGLPAAATPSGDDETPVPGTLGNDVAVAISLLAKDPALLGVELSSSMPCGSDSQLLVYAAADGHWQRKLQWSSGLDVEKDLDFSSELAGDFFLAGLVHVDDTPDGWRVVIAHGTPWCTSRFSSFGLAVVAPNAGATDGQTVWHTRRDSSRGGDFVPRLKVSGDTFELRINADEMEFDQGGFERTVIYRYRVSPAAVARLQPIALNARGFVEEWLSMPWAEARAQQRDPDDQTLQQLHQQAQAHDEREYTSWEAGPVRACTASDRFQVAFDSQQERTVVGKPGGEQGPPVHHFFELQTVPGGYQLVSVGSAPDPACTGPDLMQKRGGAARPRSPR